MKNNIVAKNTAQQGDVLLKRVEALPAGTRKTVNKNKLVLAGSESAGHYHGIDSDGSTLVEVDGVRFINIQPLTDLLHQEHNPITLDGGIWQVGIVNEYDYFAKMVRKVID